MKGFVAVSMLVFVAAAVQMMMMVKSGEASVTCGQVDASFASCIPYLMAGGNPTTACCDGIKNLKNITLTTVDRRAAYDCVKAAAARYPNIKENAASSLPQKCGVEMNIPISKTTDCAIIN